jgi:omega-6 fatty acid desaturase (delta-12 desaturase)
MLALTVALLAPGLALHAPVLRAVPAAPLGRVRMVATSPALSTPDDVQLSGLNGKALAVTMADVPSKADIKRVVPAHCFTRQTGTSLRYLAQSLAIQAGLFALGRAIPLTRAMLPLWVAYALVTGTAATGLWVLAHECGHGAFSDNRRLQNGVGYVLHSALLVPYFSWQRSHAVHHAHTNHISDGETHVPMVVQGDGVTEHAGGEKDLASSRAMGKGQYGALQLLLHLVFGWPAYLLAGKTGGPKYGVSNHFWPTAPFSKALWPAQWAKKVWRSDWGIGFTLACLGLWAAKAGIASVMAMYVAPLVVVNAWLVAYTWLQVSRLDLSPAARSARISRLQPGARPILPPSREALVALPMGKGEA